MARLIYLAPMVLAFLLAVLACLPWARPHQPKWIVTALVYVLLDGAVTVEAPHIPGTHWNWIGKATSIAFALVIVAALRPSSDESALRWPRKPGEWLWTVLGIMGTTLFACGVNFAFRDHQVPDAEQLLYEATLPGLSEEFCWRGVLFVLLGRAYAFTNGKPNLIPAAVVSTVMFGLIHGISLDNGSPRFAWLPFTYATAFGVWLAVVRLRARSLASLVVAHNFANTCGVLIGAIP